jgi:hypothetical protein
VRERYPRVSLGVCATSRFLPENSPRPEDDQVTSGLLLVISTTENAMISVFS